MAQTESLTQTALLVLLAIVAIPLVMMVVMMPMMWLFGWGHMGAWMMNGSGGWTVMLLMMLIPLLVVGGAGYLLYQSLTAASTETENNAVAELRRAYARGDISDEEFDKRRERLAENNET